MAFILSNPNGKLRGRVFSKMQYMRLKWIIDNG